MEEKLTDVWTIDPRWALIRQTQFMMSRGSFCSSFCSSTSIAMKVPDLPTPALQHIPIMTSHTIEMREKERGGPAVDNEWAVRGKDIGANSANKLQHGVSGVGHSVVRPGSEVELGHQSALSTVLVPLADHWENQASTGTVT